MPSNIRRQVFNSIRFFIKLSFFALLCIAAAQDKVTLTCSFSTPWNGYRCLLNNIEVLDQEIEVEIVGVHLEGRSDADVNVVSIQNSRTPFMIQQIFEKFPNIVELEISGSHLESIEIPDNVQLTNLRVPGNRIRRIFNGTFAEQNRLQSFAAVGSEIEEIEENAFVGLGALTVLVLSNNRISNIAQKTFEPLTNVERIQLDRNLLTRIDDIFSTNSKLSVLFIDQNQINKISPRFTATIQKSLRSLDLRRNQCIDRSLVIRDEIDLMILHNWLQKCFNRFAGNASVTRKVVLEFEGPMSLYDEYGNIVAEFD
jgi:Leucine-rich repeat (LRR) protein